MPVLASLGIRAKKLSPPQRDQGKKDAFVHVCSTSPIFLCLGGSLPTSSAFNTSNNGCHYNCFSFTSQNRPIMNQMGPCDEHPYQCVTSNPRECGAQLW